MASYNLLRISWKLQCGFVCFSQFLWFLLQQIYNMLSFINGSCQNFTKDVMHKDRHLILARFENKTFTDIMYIYFNVLNFSDLLTLIQRIGEFYLYAPLLQNICLSNIFPHNK